MKLKEFLLKYKWWLVGAFVFVLAVSAFWWYLRPVVVVNGENITRKDVVEMGTKFSKYYKKIDANYSLLDIYEEAKKLSIEEIAVETESAKRNISVSDKEIDEALSVSIKKFANKESYFEFVKKDYGWDEDQVKHRIKIDLLRNKLKEVLLTRYVVDGYYVRYDFYAKDQTAVDKAKNKMLDIRQEIVSGAKVDDIYKKYENDKVWRAPFSAELHYDYLNDSNEKDNFEGREDWTAIKKLKNKGDVTEIVKSSGGYFATYRLENKIIGEYDSWEAYLESFEKESGLLARINTVLKASTAKALAGSCAVNGDSASSCCSNSALKYSSSNDCCNMVDYSDSAHYGTVKGHIYDNVTKSAISGVRVTLNQVANYSSLCTGAIDALGPPPFGDTTDVNGYYAMGGVNCWLHYSVTASKTGYYDTIVEADVKPVNGGTTIVGIRYLDPIPPAPTCSLSFNPSTVSEGAQTTVNYTLGGGAPSAKSIDNGIGDVVSGTVATVNFGGSATKTYTMSVSNDGGSNTCSTTINQGPTACVINNFSATSGGNTVGAGGTLNILKGSTVSFATGSINSSSSTFSNGVNSSSPYTYNNIGTYTATYSCSGIYGGAGTSYSITIVVGPVCGDGVKEGSEACDAGVNTGVCPASTCSSSCTIRSCVGGCTDSNAMNYNSSANYSSGSCTYCDISPITVTGATQNADGTYSVDVSDGPKTINFNGTVSHGSPIWSISPSSTNPASGTGNSFSASFTEPGHYNVALDSTEPKCSRSNITVIANVKSCSINSANISTTVGGQAVSTYATNSRQPINITFSAAVSNILSTFESRWTLGKDSPAYDSYSKITPNPTNYASGKNDFSPTIPDAGSYRVTFEGYNYINSNGTKYGTCTASKDITIDEKPYCSVSPTSGDAPLVIRGEAELPGSGNYEFTITSSSGAVTKISNIIANTTTKLASFIKTLEAVGAYEIKVTRGGLNETLCNPANSSGQTKVNVTNPGSGNGGEITPN